MQGAGKVSKCGDFGVGQKCGVKRKLHGAAWRCYITGLVYSGL